MEAKRAAACTVSTRPPAPTAPTEPPKCVADDEDLGSEVWLSIYDMTQLRALQLLNQVVQPLGGGVFHVGVVVWEKEYSYGCTLAGTGLAQMGPGRDPGHQFHSSVHVGYTKLSQKEVEQLVASMADMWQGPKYHYLKHNCTHFARTLMEKLGSCTMPDWVDSLARSAMQAVSPFDYVFSALTCSTASASPRTKVVHVGA